MAQHGISRPSGEIVRNEPVRHDVWLRNRLTGILTLTLTTPPGQYVSPGTGRLALTGEGPTAVVAQQAERAAGTPVLPGSGIKGAVRTHYEILSSSCDPFAWTDRSRRHEERCTRRSCCEACSLFGVLGWTGRVSFGDAAPLGAGAVQTRVEEVPTPWGPHGDKTRGDFRIYDQAESVQFEEDTRTWRKRPKDLTREVYTGAFETRMTFWNTTAEELGRLLVAMGLGADEATRFDLRLGGVKYDGKGAVTVAPTRLRLSAGGVPGVLAEEACRQQCRAWILAARTSGWGRTFARTLDDLVRTLHRKD
ncbi:MAG TPA: hypothetical protein DD490_03785 [Acidobacteria bacterium]|nr:hypothetical protein [Acidobacteriota bacterium]